MSKLTTDDVLKHACTVTFLCALAAASGYAFTTYYFENNRDAQAGVGFACFLPLLVVPFAIAARLIFENKLVRIALVILIAIAIVAGTGGLSAKLSWGEKLPFLLMLGLPMFIIGIPIAAGIGPLKDVGADRAKQGLCPRCSYDLRGSPTDRCPECGTEKSSPPAP